MSKKLLNHLEKFDLNDVEAQLYLSLLDKSPQKYLDLSRSTRIPRSSVYDNIEKLIEKGLVSIIKEGASKTLVARPPDFLGDIIEDQQKKLQDLNKSYSILKTHFQNIAPNTAHTKTINFKDRQGIRQLLDDRLSAVDEIVSFSNLGLSQVVGRNYYQEWLRTFRSKKIINRAIINPERSVLDYLKDNVLDSQYHHDLEDIRYLLKTRFYIVGDVSIYNDTISLIYYQGSVLLGTKINNHHFAKLQLDLFKQLWFQAKPISELIK